MRPGVTAIILAAGLSSRLGSPKQLVDIDGKPLLRRTVETALASQCARVLVILGYESATIAPALAGLSVEIVENRQWSEGIASSIRAGIEDARNDEAILITPCDLPRLTAAHLDALIAHYQAGNALVASQWDDACGPPALFSPNFYPELQELRGDVGAREVLRKHGDAVWFVPFPAGRFDIDTPDDL